MPVEAANCSNAWSNILKSIVLEQQCLLTEERKQDMPAQTKLSYNKQISIGAGGQRKREN